MGNLSCVSCRTADAKERPMGKKQRPPSDKHSPETEEPEPRNNHEAAKPSICSQSSPQNEKPPVIRSPNEVNLTFGGNDVRVATKPASAWDLYEVLRQHRVKEVDENGVAPVVKAARAIVEINVFLASQVIYPAYLRYLSEDHPDLYTQYFERPDSPTPPYNSDGELPVYNSESHSSSPDEPSPTSEGPESPG
ncbi:hypothetical protein CAPTEDRAFT_224990 [Capitella teleta]|uniref:Uncharacterized protein n=1 Tax=Capitella teleta TaxID=283909 RepID=R7V8R8_CAPTE|nr:hypothetical protein CAPTEDRAFT_224990 [Capitella teleta]|eukprot:ELU12140.1 hypothetical protein CAPTEDRAFT_224990 [Capitella teleta]